MLCDYDETLGQAFRFSFAFEHPITAPFSAEMAQGFRLTIEISDLT